MRDSRPVTTRTDGSTGTESTDRRDTAEVGADEADAGETSRRRLLFVAGGLVAGSALTTSAIAAHENHYELGARTSHWGGEEPSEIEGEENPTITFTAGEEYTITWHNRDGNYHKLLIRNEDGETLENSPGNNEEGGTEAVTFVATEQMHDYQCEPHFSMRGDIEIVGTTSEPDETPTETPTEEPAPTAETTPTDESTATDEPTPTATDGSMATEEATATGTGVSADEETATDTETPAEQATVTDAVTATRTDGPGGNGTTSPGGGIVDPEDQSVFGVGSVVTGVGGLVYLLRRRFADGAE